MKLEIHGAPRDHGTTAMTARYLVQVRQHEEPWQTLSWSLSEAVARAHADMLADRTGFVTRQPIHHGVRVRCQGVVVYDPRAPKETA